MKPILVTSGEPAGIGPDLCLSLINHPAPLVVVADPEILRQRAAALGQTIAIQEYFFDRSFVPKSGHLSVYPISCPVVVEPGVLNSEAAQYVLNMLQFAAEYCLSQKAAAVVTAPVHKAIINRAGILFSGHTEYFAQLTGNQTVMLLVSDKLKVSLVTTHLPLQKVSSELTREALVQHLAILHRSLQKYFGMRNPRLKVLGLNPHAGEDGYLGHEEQNIIRPAILDCQRQGLAVEGPFSADTAFLDFQDWDAIVAMYHDQGLPVLKFASFGHAVNVSCGLPFIRTSVDHGTALTLAGTGRASPQSLLKAVQLATEMVACHEKR